MTKKRPPPPLLAIIILKKLTKNIYVYTETNEFSIVFSFYIAKIGDPPPSVIYFISFHTSP